MSKVDENIVREYFEGNRFLVRQLRPEPGPGRKKAGEEENYFLVFNPTFRLEGRRPDFLLFSSELPFIERAVVTVRSWQAPRFTPAILKSGAKLFRFLEQNVGQRAADAFPAGEALEGMGNALRISVLPGLPTVEPYRRQSIELLQSRGVDGIISFRSMLLEIISRVSVSGSYHDSETLELVRVLKNYDLFSDPQLELFGGNRG